MDSSMAEQGLEPVPEPEPGCAWRLLALCGAAVFLATAAAGGALLAWNLASSTSWRSRCPEPAETNATAQPGDPAPEVKELQQRLAEAARREEALARQLGQAEGIRGELEEALRACEGRQVRGQGGRPADTSPQGTHFPCLRFPNSSAEGGTA